ncbi:hypothetical protein Tco_0129648, partial [Tanacetum coccineum]
LLGSLPHAHTQASKTYNWHQSFKKSRKLRTVSGEIASFQDDAKYEHIGSLHTVVQGCSRIESVGLHQTTTKVPVSTIKFIHNKERFKDLRVQDKVKRQ